MIWVDVVVLIVTIICVSGLICATILRNKKRKKNGKGCSGCFGCNCCNCPFVNTEEK